MKKSRKNQGTISVTENRKNLFFAVLIFFAVVYFSFFRCTHFVEQNEYSEKKENLKGKMIFDE